MSRLLPNFGRTKLTNELSLRAVKYFFRELHHFAFSDNPRPLFDSSFASLRSVVTT
jgi:hypothetical protein